MKHVVLMSLLWCGCSSLPAWRVAEDTRTPDRAAFVEVRGDVDAVRAMGRLTAPELVPELKVALAQPKTRVVAAWAMGQYGLVESFDSQASLALELRDALRVWTTDLSADVRAAVAVASGRLRDEDTARALTQDPDARVRAAAVLGLFWHTTLGATLSPASIDVLIAAASDPDPNVRRALAIAGSRKPDARMEATLRALVDDGGETAMFAIRGLGKLEQSAETTELLVASTRARERTTRIEAALALKDHAGLPSLADDPDLTVRAVYAQRTGVVAPDEASGWVRSLAITARAAYGFDATWLADPDARVRAAAAAQLARSKTWQPLFEQAFADESLNVKLAAIGSLGEIEGNEPAERLKMLLATLPPDPTSRGAAVEAAVARKSQALVPELVKIAQASSGSEFIELRETVVTALADLEAWADVARFVDDPAPSVRIKAQVALAKHEGRAPPAIDRRAPQSPYLGADAAHRISFETDAGAFVIELDRARAPTTAAAISALAKRGFYDGTTFHRLVPSFVLQGGDPTGTGWGDAGFQLRDEVSELPYATGTVGLAKAGPDTGSCQLFVTLAPTPHLEGRYTIVGRVVSGLDVVMQLELGAIIRTARVLP